MAFKKFWGDLFNEQGGKDDEQNEEQTVEETEEEVAEVRANPAQPAASARREAPVSASSNALELKICKPQSFAEVGSIADHLLNYCTVVLNLETTSKETARRIVDFLNGVTYSIDGQIKPVANNTFVITPKSVSVTGEDNEEVPEEIDSSEDSSFAGF